MKILKGTLLDVNHSRKGQFTGIAFEDFDIDDEWYSIKIAKRSEGGNTEVITGINPMNKWCAGEEIPCRKGLCMIKVIELPHVEDLKELFSPEAFARMKEELAEFHRTGIPRCLTCRTPFVNAVDTITGKVSDKLWQPACGCYSKKLILSVG
jgi:hypothetical protein